MEAAACDDFLFAALVPMVELNLVNMALVGAKSLKMMELKVTASELLPPTVELILVEDSAEWPVLEQAVAPNSASVKKAAAVAGKLLVLLVSTMHDEAAEEVECKVLVPMEQKERVLLLDSEK